MPNQWPTPAMTDDPTDKDAMIKVHLWCGGPSEGYEKYPETEGVWAEVVAEQTVRLWNIPTFTDTYHLYDIVAINAEDQAVCLLEQHTNTWLLRYQAGVTKTHTLSIIKRVRSYLETHQIVCESPGPGFLIVAYPLEMTRDELQAISEGAPIPVQLVEEQA